ncbi:MAG: Wzz/FepE/Etk N-terminal domain-containing protein [Bacteroidetes bacterium]|nr:Wzz/FepE/Etk N-terminal domain-containing protein [Bacteroidota bacterium]
MKETHIPTPPADSDPDEIDLLALAKTLWNGRRTVLKSILICGVIGLFVALTSPKEYVATTIMVPSGSSSGASLGGLGGLAAMAGINLATQTGSELSPTIYPRIVSSLPYQLELIKTPLKFKELNAPVTFLDYYTGLQKPNLLLKYTIGLPSLIIGIPSTIISALKGREPEKVEIFANQKPIELSVKQQSAISTLSGMISLSIDFHGN